MNSPRQSAQGAIQTTITMENMDRWQEAIKKTPEVVGAGVAAGFRELAIKGRKLGLGEIKRGLTIRSVKYFEYGIKGTPIKPNQESALKRAFVSRSFTAEGSVYVRDHTNPQNSLDFLINHETGKNKIATKGLIAVPDAAGLGEYRTPTGATQPGLKPRTLMRDYAADMQTKGRSIPWRDGAMLVRNAKTGRAFIPHKKSNGKRGRNSRLPYIRLYTFKTETQQTKKINFEGVVSRYIRSNINPVCEKHISDKVNQMIRTI